jgi:hypothetical protein
MTKHKRTWGREATSSHGPGRRLLAGGAAVVALLLAACGGGGTAVTDRPVTTAPPTAPPTAAPPHTALAVSSTPMPAIVVSHPSPGDTVHSPFHVTGTADTFEAVFRVQLRDGSGRVVVDQQVQATSGTGTRGSFDTIVSTTAKGAATLVAYERSARDGSPINTVTLHITLG